MVNVSSVVRVREFPSSRMVVVVFASVVVVVLLIMGTIFRNSFPLACRVVSLVAVVSMSRSFSIRSNSVL